MNPTDPSSPADPRPTASTWPQGHRIGNFELLSALPPGRVGHLYRAWDHALARLVAVKEYFPAGLARRDENGAVQPIDAGAAEAFERGLHRFVDEWRTLARCDHPRLVRMLQVFEAHGTVYGVMPWYAGRPLPQARQAWAAPLDERRLRALLDDLLSALELYHRVGGVHGAVEPSKVMWLDDGHALLLGPGASASATAPQDSNDAGEGLQVDIHGLARVARCCITGELPLAQGLGVPESLSAAVERLYFDQPGVRYSAALLRALDQALSPDRAKHPASLAQFRAAWADAPLPPVRAQPAASDPATAGPLDDTPEPAQPAGPPLASSTALAPESAAIEAAEPGLEPEHALGFKDAESVDPAAADAIRRLLASIPDSPREPAPGRGAPPPRGPAPPVWDGDDTASARADPGDPGDPTEPRRPRRWRVALAALVLTAIAMVAWQALAPGGRYAGTELQATAVPLPVDLPAPAAGIKAPPLPEPSASIAADEPARAAALHDPDTSPVAAPASTGPRSAAAPDPVEPTARVAATPSPVVQSEPVAIPVPVPAPASAPIPAPKAAAAPSNPRAQCGARTDFSLYRCMQQQCSQSRWQAHPQCVRFKATDAVE